MIIDAERMADSIQTARPLRIGPAVVFTALMWCGVFAGFVIGRATAPDRGMTWAEMEALVCTPIHDALPAPARKEIEL